MIILLPPSETKTQHDRGDPVDLLSLSFPELTEAREVMMDRLVEISAREDAIELLKVGRSLAAEVERNTRLRELPAAPALRVYSGVLFDALGYTFLPEWARLRADQHLVIMSALWGALRPTDEIPAYRLSTNSRVAAKGTLAAWWKGELGPVLKDAVGDQLVIDCRSAGYRAMWKPPVEHTVEIQVERIDATGRSVVSHMSKYYRGLIAREVLLADFDLESADDLAEVLSGQCRVELTESLGKKPAMLTVVIEE